MLVDVHLGVVMVNDSDPDKAFGVEVMIDSLLQDNIWPELCRPIFPPNSAKAPDIGQVIECIVIADEHDESGWSDLGVENEPDFCFYTGRIFNLTDEGKIPEDLKVNYPKRAGLFWDIDGTIIYYDSTSDKKEYMVALTDRKVFFRLKEDEIFIQLDTISWQMKAGKIVTTVDATEMGAAGASEPILLGDIVYDAFMNGGNGLLKLWLTASSILGGPADPTGAKASAYGTAMNTAVSIFEGTLTNWRSSKHKVDA